MIFILEIILLFLFIFLLCYQMMQMWIPEYEVYNEGIKMTEVILIGGLISDFLWRRVKNEELLVLFSPVPIFFIVLFITMTHKYLWLLISGLFILILNYLVKDKKIRLKIYFQLCIILLMLLVYLVSFFTQNRPCDLICSSKPMQKIENIYIYQIRSNRSEPGGALQIYEREGKIPLLTPKNIEKIKVYEGIKTVKRQDDSHVELLIDEGSNSKKCILNTKTWDEECEFLNK